MAEKPDAERLKLFQGVQQVFRPSKKSGRSASVSPLQLSTSGIELRVSAARYNQALYAIGLPALLFLGVACLNAAVLTDFQIQAAINKGKHLKNTEMYLSHLGRKQNIKLGSFALMSSGYDSTPSNKLSWMPQNGTRRTASYC